MTLPRFENKQLNLAIIIFFVVSYFFIYRLSCQASSLFLNPATGVIDSKTFSLALTMDTEDSTDINNTEVFLAYDPATIKVVEIIEGDLDNYTIKEIDPGIGLVTIEGNLATTPLNDQILQIATLQVESLSNNTPVTIEILTASPYNSSITDSVGINTLTNTVDANITVTYENTNINSNYSSNTNVPNTGSYTVANIAILSGAVVILSFFIKRYAVSKL